MKAANILFQTLIGAPVMASTLVTWFVLHMRRARAESELTAADAWLDEAASDPPSDADDRLDEATAALLG